MVRLTDSYCGVKEGRRYGSRVVLGKLFSVGSVSNRTSARWSAVVRCDCGHVGVTLAGNLSSGGAGNCKGCRNRQVSTTHGGASGPKWERLYSIWAGMKKRCNLKSHHAYKNYGGRGIKICEAWLDYSEFRAWAVKNGYEDNLTIDRIDNEKGYEPGNCQWLTKADNTRKRKTDREAKANVTTSNL